MAVWSVTIQDKSTDKTMWTNVAYLNDGEMFQMLTEMVSWLVLRQACELHNNVIPFLLLAHLMLSRYFCQLSCHSIQSPNCSSYSRFWYSDHMIQFCLPLYHHWSDSNLVQSCHFQFAVQNKIPLKWETVKGEPANFNYNFIRRHDNQFDWLLVRRMRQLTSLLNFLTVLCNPARLVLYCCR